MTGAGGRKKTAKTWLGLGAVTAYLAVLVLIPLAACVVKATSLSWSQFLAAVTDERAQAAYALTFGAAAVAAAINGVVGTAIAWVLVRYPIPFRAVLDAIVDVPFALPTAVAGLVYSSLYAQSGWLGSFLVPLGFEGAYSRTAVVLVLTFVGLPFVVRTVQPILVDLDAEIEEASACLGANRWQTFRMVLFPTILPAVLTGVTLAFARALGEYGSVVFVSGNMPFKTEIAPVLIVAHLESFQYAEANAIATVLLACSFASLAVINGLQRWSGRYG